ncbi:PREDICTED: putative pentatricopeptide repeat-containing protein At3g25970 [Nicotiana attenuata]|uniref:Pentatricopeptide repeat-containing protein n=1 Tax=Nicotiana attenuata TaxID=49451 RepID=A0A1J6I3A3_NICAT|nr:PREDICTED: putative pentatricopeptide repeat-containing protein At3g25970 [Nicotiana attenuata]OIS99549.1 putative pentatricopeptide repeat-containing protein [Nicotiana attenuata]
MRLLNSLAESSATTLSKVTATHCRATKLGRISDTYTATNILNGYTKCREIGTALKLFDEIPHKDTASWNIMVSGYVNSGKFHGAWLFLNLMKEHGFCLNDYTFGSILKGIASNGLLSLGQQVHCDVVKMGYVGNVYSASALLDMYAKCGKVDDANKVFQRMPERNYVAWNAIIAGYAGKGDIEYCFWLLRGMEQEAMQLDDGTFSPLLTLLNEERFYKLTMQVHAKVEKLGLCCQVKVVNALITAYSQCGSIESAQIVFDGTISCRDLVTWNSMLAAYLEHDEEKQAFELFLDMERLGLEMDSYTYTSIISGCFEDRYNSQGKCLHALIIKRGLENVTIISNALISMYAKSCTNYMDDALTVFGNLDVKDSVSWNSILTGLSQKGWSEIALNFFLKMRVEHLEMDEYCFSATLRSCSDLATLQLGQQIHALALKLRSESYTYVSSALILLYSNCGIIEDAWKSFEVSPKESSISWNSIMFAYAQHGQGKLVLDLFFLMKQSEVKLDHITFVAVLTACSHIGLVEEGRHFFKSMEADFGIVPRMEHYACAIDLLGRAGRLEEAKELVKGMPFDPDAMVLRTLLGVCRSCGDIEYASEVASRLLELEPGDHSTYVLLSDMYRQIKKWDKIANIKRLMREKSVSKVPGWSWIELQNEVHAFNAEDLSHPRCREIYSKLRELTDEIMFSESENASGLTVSMADLESVV